MRLGIARSIAFLALAILTGSALAQGLMSVTGEAADIAARQMEERLKEEGLSLNKKDIERLNSYYSHVTYLTELRKRVTLSGRAASAAGLTKEANAMAAERKALDTIWKQLPSDPPRGSGNMPGFWQQLQKYQSQRLKSNATRLAKSEKLLNDVNKVLDKQARGGSGSSEGRLPGQWAGIVIGLGPQNDAPGTMSFFVNGQEVTGNGQEIKVSLGKPVIIRAVGVDARRSMIRKFQETAATSLKGTPTDYFLSYETQSGNFKGSSSFNMGTEEYSWSISLSGDRDAEYKISDSKLKIGLAQDLATLTFGNQVTMKITVSMSIAWKASSMRPAGRRESTENGTAKGTITLKFLPD